MLAFPLPPRIGRAPLDKTLWTALSLLGDSRLLLVLVATLAIACPRPRWPLLRRWLPALGLVASLTLFTKLAFMGWGIGSAALDFTGVSGHAAMSGAMYPVVAALLAAGRSPHPARWAMAGGVLALLVSTSRLPLNAHSPSEVIVGSLLGLMASAWTLRGLELPRGRLRVVGLAVPLLLALLLPTLPPSMSSHRAVQRTALMLSGNERVHTRAQLHRQPSSNRQALSTSASSSTCRLCVKVGNAANSTHTN